MIYKITILKKTSKTGVVEVEADSPEEAADRAIYETDDSDVEWEEEDDFADNDEIEVLGIESEDE